MSVVYRVSDVLYFLIYRVVGYRTKVVRQNLMRTFPEKSIAEIEQIESSFYVHLADLIMESVKQFSIRKKEIQQKVTVVNPELLVELGKKHKRIIVAAGHYGNWELTSVALGMYPEFTVQGIYTPLKDAFLDKKLMTSRERYGMRMLSRRDIKMRISQPPDHPEVLLFATDQTPSNERKCYWMDFLGQETPVFFGAEKFAVENDFPVVFGRIAKPRRGYYELSFELLEENSSQAPYGRITEQHTRALEDEIRAYPAHWLWTHKRWKKTRPADMPLYGQQVKSA